MGATISSVFRSSSWVSNMLWAGTGLLSLVLGALYVYQDNLLYHPFIPGVPKTPKENPPGFRSPEDHAVLDYEEHFIKTEDGALVHAWLLLQRDSLSVPTVVYFHGNAGNMGFRLPHGTNIFKQCKVNVLLMDYRGYGSSQGKPTEAGLLKDAEAVLTTLKEHPRITNDKIIIYGKSLGGAVALALVENYPEDIMALVLENTFLSIPAMVDVLLPFVKLFKSLILRIGWHNDERIKRVTQPLLFISGLADELVPPSHMMQLRRLATRSRYAQLYTVADGTHNDTMFKGGIAYYRTFREFIIRVSYSHSAASSSTTTSTTTTEKTAVAVGAGGRNGSGVSSSGNKQQQECINNGEVDKEGSIPLMPNIFLNQR